MGSAIENVPFLGGYVAAERESQDSRFRKLQQASVLLNLHQRAQEQQQAEQLRSTLSTSNGDVEKVLQAALASGNINAAQKLAPLVKIRQEERQRQETARAFQQLYAGETNPVSSPGPQELGEGQPIATAGDDAVRPSDPMARNQERIRNLQRFMSVVGHNPVVAQRVQAEIDKLQSIKPMIEHNFSIGDDRVQPHISYDEGRSWQPLPGSQPSAKFARQVDQAGGDQTFGSGLTGRAINILTRDATAYAEGRLTPDQERVFIAASTQYQQPRQYQNPDTGQLETSRPELPPFVADALRKRGQRVPASRPNPFIDEPKPGRPQPAPSAERPSKTAWDLAPLTTGPVPAAAEMLSRTPLVGDMVQAPQFTQARAFIPQLQRDLVRTLHNNVRYPEGERKAIEKDISIEPRLFDNQVAYRNRLVGIDDALEVRERNAYATAQSARVGRDERVQAMNVLNALRNFRENLGVPPRIRTEAEYNELPSGGVYIDTRDGKPKRKK